MWFVADGVNVDIKGLGWELVCRLVVEGLPRVVHPVVSGVRVRGAEVGQARTGRFQGLRSRDI